MAVREAEPVGSLQDVKDAGLDREDLLGIYRHLLTTRGIEERGHILYKQGKIPGSFYTGRGNEALRRRRRDGDGADDVGTPLQRDMGVHVVRGVEPWRVFAQYMGRADGPTKGRDGNVHIGDPCSACTRWSATCRRCSRSPSAWRSRSGSARRSAWRSPGAARAPRRAATRTKA